MNESFDSRYLNSWLSVNDKGHLQIEKVDTVELAKEFGTPLWVLSEATIRNNFRELKQAFEKRYPSVTIVFASKSNHLPVILRIVLQEGGNIDFVSIGQFHIARIAGANPSKLVFNGNNKTVTELETAVNEGVGLLNIDSLDELYMLEEICKRLNKRIKIAIRVRTGFSDLADDEPDFVNSNTVKHKFGIDIQSGQAFEACKIAMGMKFVELVGLHHHAGWTAYGTPYDRSKDLSRCKSAVEEVVDLALTVEKKLGMKISVLDLGGGFRKTRPHPFGPGGITSIPTIDEYAQLITSTIKEKFGQAKSDLPELLLEPGGYIVTDAVTLLSTVGNIKEVKEGAGKGKWVAVDSSAYMFARKLIFNFFHQTVIANKMLEPLEEEVDIVGNACTYDYIADGVMVPRLRRGDLVATLDQGSYCEVISTQYNAIPRPATVIVNGSEKSIVRRRETTEDLTNLYSIPNWLNLNGGNSS